MKSNLRLIMHHLIFQGFKMDDNNFIEKRLQGIILFKTKKPVIEIDHIDNLGRKYLNRINPIHWLNRAMQLNTKNNYKEAIKLIDSVININPDLKEAYIIKSNILKKLDKEIFYVSHFFKLTHFE